MKWWHALLGIVAVVVIWSLIIPPSIRCKMQFWDKNACANIQTASKVLNLNPDESMLTQLDEASEAFQRQAAA